MEFRASFNYSLIKADAEAIGVTALSADFDEILS